jgi:hypothetical protein
MAEELLCPVRGIGRMKRTGVLAATRRDEERNEVKGNFRGYKCDNPDCGYPEGGQNKVTSVKEYVEMEEEEGSATNAHNI